VHLIVPGRRQAGPVGIVGASYRETLPAAAHFLAHLTMNQNQESNNINRNENDDDTSSSDSTPRENKIELDGRVFVNNALDANPTGIVGKWTFSSSSMINGIHPLQIQPYWLFESSSSWSVLACPLELSSLELNKCVDPLNNPNNHDDEIEKSFPPTATGLTTLELLKTCLDNAVFRLGSANLSNLFFSATAPKQSFASDILTNAALYSKMSPMHFVNQKQSCNEIAPSLRQKHYVSALVVLPVRSTAGVVVSRFDGVLGDGDPLIPEQNRQGELQSLRCGPQQSQ
jgi:hypothetical protein